MHEALATLRAIDDPSRPRLAGGRAAVVVLRRERPGHRALRARGRRAASWARPADAAAPGGRGASRPPSSCCAAARAAAALSVPALLERLYDRDARAGRAHRHAPRRGARAEPGEGGGAGAPGRATSGVLTLRGFTRLLQAAHQRRRARSPTCPPRGRATPAPCASSPSTRPRAWRRRSSRSTTWPPPAARGASVIALWEEGTIAVGFRAGLPAAGLGGARPSATRRGRGRRAGGCSTWPARARATCWSSRGRPPTRRSGDFWRDLRAPRCRRRRRRRARGRRGDAARAGTRRATRWTCARWPRPRGGRRGRRALGRCASRRALVETARLPCRSCPSPATAGRPARRRPPAVLRRDRRRRPRLRRPRPPHPGVDPARRRDARARWRPWPRRSRPRSGSTPTARTARAAAAARALALPVMERARRAARRWRELPVWFPDGERAGRGRRGPGVRGGRRPRDRGLQDRPHRRRSRPWPQAAHHAPQLQLYGRGLAQATGLPVRERLVLFTALGQAVPV